MNSFNNAVTDETKSYRMKEDQKVLVKQFVEPSAITHTYHVSCTSCLWHMALNRFTGQVTHSENLHLRVLQWSVISYSHYILQLHSPSDNDSNEIMNKKQNCLWGSGDTFDRNEMFTSLVIRSRSLSVEENWFKLLGFCCKQIFMKLFQTSNIDIVECCQSHFCFDLPSVVHGRRARKFDIKYRDHSNPFCQMISHLWMLVYSSLVSLFRCCRFCCRSLLVFS